MLRYENYLLSIKLLMVRYGKTITYMFILLILRSRNTPYNYYSPLSLTRRGVRGEVVRLTTHIKRKRQTHLNTIPQTYTY